MVRWWDVVGQSGREREREKSSFMVHTALQARSVARNQPPLVTTVSSRSSSLESPPNQHILYRADRDADRDTESDTHRDWHR
jgi:hypothetical protein